MCFYKHRDHEKVKIAKQDIKCYKLFETINLIYAVSICRGFKYRRNKKYKVWFFKTQSFEINRGFHSWTKLEGRDRILRDDRRENYLECIIPKGAKYYYNPYDKEYVSNKIIVL